MAELIDGNNYFIGDTVKVLLRPARFMPQPDDDQGEVYGYVTFTGKCKRLEVAQSRAYYAKTADGYLYADKVKEIRHG